MANSLKYTFQIIGEDSSPITHEDLAAAKDTLDFGGWTFPDSGVAWSLADSNKTLVVTITFADGDAGRTAQDAFHNNVKDTWSYPVANTPWLSTTWGLKPDLSNVYKVTSIKDGEVDLD